MRQSGNSTLRCTVLPGTRRRKIRAPLNTLQRRSHPPPTSSTQMGSQKVLGIAKPWRSQRDRQTEGQESQANRGSSMRDTQLCEKQTVFWRKGDMRIWQKKWL